MHRAAHGVDELSRFHSGRPPASRYRTTGGVPRARPSRPRRWPARPARAVRAGRHRRPRRPGGGCPHRGFPRPASPRDSRRWLRAAVPGGRRTTGVR
ncbi:hypothetical protein E6W17_37575 [Streptomyces sp. A1547]|nr:hypothetical protein E6W17_37575 [Streptomyces sp. A1547]